MIALSLTQPWAQLMADGRKRVETRSWSTRHQGLLAIAAAKGWTAEDRELAARWGYDPAELPRGAIVATVRLAEVRPTTGNAPGLEGAYGDYRLGRYAWRTFGVQKLAVPVPCRGALGLWRVPADVEAAVREQLARAAA